jgi:hypothetical protein
VRQVKHSIEDGAAKCGGEVSHVGKRVLVLDCLQVQLAVVAAWLPGAFLLLDHVERTAPLAGRTADDALVEHGLELKLGGF